MRPRDTSPEAWSLQLALLRQMPPEERLARTFIYSALVRSFAEAELQRQFPQASEREIFLRAARQRLGHDLFQRVFGDELGA